MKIQIIQVPYDSGLRSTRMGCGPEQFVQNGIEQALRLDGYDVDLDCVEAHDPFRSEIKTTFELCRTVAERVRSAYDQGDFPLVLSGNCNSSLGTMAGVGPNRLGVIWFDGHGDFNTPETSESGFLDGMSLATAVGLCWKKIATSIPNFSAIPGGHIVHVGGRDFGAQEKALFEASRGTIVGAEAIRRAGMAKALTPALEDLRSRVQRIYVHFDLDVLDPGRSPANEFAAPDGITVAHIQEAIGVIGERFTICASGVASYDPRYDTKDEVLDTGIRIIKSTLAAAMSGRG